MQFEDLRKLSIAAAMDLVDKGQRPVAPTIVVPGGSSTQLVALTGFPDDDEARHDYLARFAADQLAANRVPAWGFVVQAEINGVEAVVVVYGARKKAPELTAAPLLEDGLAAFVEPEELDPTAMPFLHPLQHAVDALPAEPADRMSGPGPIPGPDDPDAGLPLFGG
ncbi:MAG TPA: hypothetical protein VJ978_08090 [Nitriliruptoraceae bacterium]|nr:hypothetical protein [Nitriliruptoraceae bacterium]